MFRVVCVGLSARWMVGGGVSGVWGCDGELSFLISSNSWDNLVVSTPIESGYRVAQMEATVLLAEG
jgi:hypothetical protein